MVELILVLPMLLMLISAVVHFGLLFHTLIQIRHSIVIAATYAASHPNDDSAILATLDKAFPGVVDPQAASKAVVTNGSRNKGDLMSISVSYDVAFLKQFPFGAIIPAPTQVSSMLTFPIVVGD